MEITEDIIVNAGQILYISGDSGIGKSSLLELIVNGDTNLKGFMSDEKEFDKLYEQSAFFAKGETKLPDASIMTQITSKQNPSEEDKKIVQELLRDVDYDTAVDDIESKKGRSLGQNERVLIAKMLYRIITDKKPIAIFDEPVGQVQESLKDELVKIICECSKKYGIIVIISSHEKDIVRKYADIEFTVENSEPGNENGKRIFKPFKKEKRSTAIEEYLEEERLKSLGLVTLQDPVELSEEDLEKLNIKGLNPEELEKLNDDNEYMLKNPNEDDWSL